MPNYRYHIVNVFAESPLSGNAVAVFENASGMDDATMQALAQQMRLAKTAFLLPSDIATAAVRVFSPSTELPFSGHPALAGALVAQMKQPDNPILTLDISASVTPLWAQQERWFFQARQPRVREPEARRRHIASMLGLSEKDIEDPVLFVDTGVEHLLVATTHPDAVKACSPKPEELMQHALNKEGVPKVYVWNRSIDNISARFFSLHLRSLVEEAGSGTAAANLGGWFLHTQAPLPVTFKIKQGDHLGRASRIQLAVDANERIFVGGRVVKQCSGEVQW